MENEELKKVLNRLPVPEPSDEARNRAVQSAMAEFRLHTEKNKKKVKGFAWLDRLISKKPKGGFFMNRSIAISTAGIAVSVIVFAVVFSPAIISQIRRNYAPAQKQEVQVQQKQVEYAKQPGSAAETQTDREKAQRTQMAMKEATSDANTSGNITTSETMPAVMTAENATGKTETAMADKVSPSKSGKENTASKEFALEEIKETARKREDNQQKVPVSMDVITGGDLKEQGRNDQVVSDAAEAIVDRSTDGMRVSLRGIDNAPSEDFTLQEITVTAVKRGEAQYKVPIVGEPGPAAINPEYVGRDKFEDTKPNPVKLVSEEPVSTFSIDVDTASYAFVRRALNNGYLPQADSIRIEEMINYFTYDYPLPKDKDEPFRPTVAVFQTPWNANTKLLHIGIKGYDIVSKKKPKANLTFLIDVSGSMESEDKLPLLKNSLRMLVDTLDKDDTVAIAVYAGAAGTVLERTNASEKSRILAAIDQLQAGGSTAGGEGIQLAYSLAEGSMDPKAVNRVILATDGDFNVGITDINVLQDFIERKRKSGVYLSVLGFGQGNYNDELMQKLAQNGNGNAAYIDNLNEARKVLVDEAYGTLFTIAKDVKIQIEFNPDMVSEYRLIGYETRQLNREDFKNDNVDAGDIGSGHSVTAIYEITPKGSNAQLIDDLRYGSKKDFEGAKKTGNASEYAFLRIRYKLPDETASREISTSIDKGNEYKKISDVPADSRFASAVAAFGQLLKGDSYINQFTYDDVISLARDTVKDDSFGYRTEFLNLVRLAKTASAMGDR